MAIKLNSSEMIGARFNRLVVISEEPKQKGFRRWACVCDCGKLTEVLQLNLRAGKIGSCGCLATGHGHAVGGSTSRTYRTWVSMKGRCSTKTHSRYAYYGGRGIDYDPRWKNFETFLADVGERPVGKTLDRIDNNRGYWPGNVRWATQSEQMSNTRRSKKNRLN